MYNITSGTAIQRTRTVFLSFILTLFLTCLLSPELVAQTSEESTGEESSQDSKPLVTEEINTAVRQGLEHLADRQKRNGSFGRKYVVAWTSLSGLAFLSAGSTPRRGRYSDQIQQALKFVISQQSARGYIKDRVTSSGRMHEHGYALLFLSQAYGMASRHYAKDKLKTAISKAIRLAESSQGQDGGWHYEPQRSGHEASVTGTILPGLRAARNVGFEVDKQVIKRAVEYVKKSQAPNGGFNYKLNSRNVEPSFSPLMLSTLNYSGYYKSTKGTPERKELSKIIEKAFEYVEKTYINGDFLDSSRHADWAAYYLTQVFFFAGGERWRNWYRKYSDRLLNRQRSDGSFPGGYGRSYGKSASTSMAVLSLTIPYRQLPIFQR